ncbi:hypothetical protein KFE25_007879 [Diacronema lutheri]|uniref:Uncharacterized protein n=1 Tax=Diacronema lutheri TaxID=2081491 RepID=A0A8J5XI15_DIALT|nr:hypothetical protein KFE25_007879 [Diacronema lutheri]
MLGITLSGAIDAWDRTTAHGRQIRRAFEGAVASTLELGAERVVVERVVGGSVVVTFAALLPGATSAAEGSTLSALIALRADALGIAIAAATSRSVLSGVAVLGFELLGVQPFPPPVPPPPSASGGDGGGGRGRGTRGGGGDSDGDGVGAGSLTPGTSVSRALPFDAVVGLIVGATLLALCCGGCGAALLRRRLHRRQRTPVYVHKPLSETPAGGAADVGAADGAARASLDGSAPVPAYVPEAGVAQLAQRARARMDASATSPPLETAGLVQAEARAGGSEAMLATGGIVASSSLRPRALPPIE